MNEALAKAQKQLENIYTLEVEQIKAIDDLRHKIDRIKTADIDLSADDLTTLRKNVAAAQRQGQSLDGELTAAQLVLSNIQAKRINALKAVFAAELEERLATRAEISDALQKARASADTLRDKLEAAEGNVRKIEFQLAQVRPEPVEIGRRKSLASLGLYGEERLLCRDRQKYQEMMDNGRGGDYVALDDNGEFIETSRPVDQWKQNVSLRYNQPAPVIDKPEKNDQEDFVCTPRQA